MIETQEEYRLRLRLTAKQRKYREVHDRSAEHVKRGIKRKRDRALPSPH